MFLGGSDGPGIHSRPAWKLILMRSEWKVQSLQLCSFHAALGNTLPTQLAQLSLKLGPQHSACGQEDSSDWNWITEVVAGSDWDDSEFGVQCASYPVGNIYSLRCDTLINVCILYCAKDKNWSNRWMNPSWCFSCTARILGHPAYYRVLHVPVSVTVVPALW